MGNNMLVFAFEEESDLERVVHSEPWSYDKHLVTFQRVKADTSIAEMDCRWCSFWVQIHNLPVRRMNHDYAKALGGGMKPGLPSVMSAYPIFCYWCGMLTHGDRDCEWWLRSKGTLRREDQQYGTWLRAEVGKPFRRVEVKVAGRSNIPRWDRRANPMNAGDTPVVGASNGGGGLVNGDGDPKYGFLEIEGKSSSISGKSKHSC
uniref:Uncharacterized protein n=1 Tax=Fagus sylvatica TaxID=28930 RepID=A0A2N9HIC2_FAGSY